MVPLEEPALTSPPHRCATGEAWQSIMLACIKGRPCDPRSYGEDDDRDRKCGSDLAYGYFVSFIFFCSFLVRFHFLVIILLSHPLKFSAF